MGRINRLGSISGADAGLETRPIDSLAEVSRRADLRFSRQVLD